MKLDNTINLDNIIQSIEDAPLEGKSEAIAKAIQAAVDLQKADVVKEYQAMFAEVDANKEAAAKFGLRTLNQEEKTFYQKIAEGTFEGNENDELLPETTLNYVFEDLKRSRPLFEHIEWAPAGLQKWIIGEVTGEAVWGELDSKITEQIKSELSNINLDTFKLSAFAFVPKGIIDLGHSWIDKYVREALIEANAAGLEKSFVVGDGKKGPIGLDKKLTGAVDGVHSERTAVKVKSLTPEGLGEVLAGLTNDGKRAVNKVILIVNPLDDFTLIKPASMFLTATGTYNTVFPTDTVVVPVVGMTRGKAILYLPGTYQAGISQMGIETSDDFKFLDHARTYKIVTYGNGRIKDESMAALLDISELKPLAFNVTTPAGETVEGV